MITYIRKSIQYIRQHHLSAYILMMLIAIASYYYIRMNNKKFELITEYYGKNQYDASVIPNGLIIYKAGVPETFNPKMSGDSSLRYERFRVGIWNTAFDIIYDVEVPCYAHTRFMVGTFVHEFSESPEITQPNDTTIVIKPKDVKPKMKLFSI